MTLPARRGDGARAVRARGGAARRQGDAPSSTAAAVSAPDSRARRLPFLPNIISVLPAWFRFRTGDARRRRRITHFGLRIFRYLEAGVVSPSL